MTTLVDNRKYKLMAVEDGDKIFSALARLEIEMVRLSAMYERRKKKLETEFEERLTPYRNAREELEQQLEHYIETHPERFVNPRTRKTVHGKYGLQKVSNIEITDKDALVKFSDDNGLELYKKEIKLLKTAIKKALSKGPVEGAKLAEGDRKYYKVEKTLLDEAERGSE
jgi:phage host-nuclease inhibitor protein Gam